MALQPLWAGHSILQPHLRCYTNIPHPTHLLLFSWSTPSTKSAHHLLLARIKLPYATSFDSSCQLPRAASPEVFSSQRWGTFLLSSHKSANFLQQLFRQLVNPYLLSTYYVSIGTGDTRETMKDNVPASRDMPKIGASPLRVASPRRHWAVSGNIPYCHDRESPTGI